MTTQKLNGLPDDSLFEHCKAEQRALVTLDLDFSNPLRFPTEDSAGTIVLVPTEAELARRETENTSQLQRSSSVRG